MRRHRKGRGGREEGKKAGGDGPGVWGAGRDSGTRLKRARLRGGRWTSTVPREQQTGLLLAQRSVTCLPDGPP